MATPVNITRKDILEFFYLVRGMMEAVGTGNIKIKWWSTQKRWFIACGGDGRCDNCKMRKACQASRFFNFIMPLPHNINIEDLLIKELIRLRIIPYVLLIKIEKEPF